MRNVPSSLLHNLAGGHSGTYWQFYNANLKPGSGSSAAGGSGGTKPTPPNWNVRPGEGAYSEGWGEDNNGLG